MPRLLVVFVLVVAAGCGGDDLTRVHPVAGRIEVNDRPAGNAHIAFHPLNSSSVRVSAGVSRPDGTFTLTTFTAGDGAPAGEYVVTVFWQNESMPLDECLCPDPSLHDRLYGLYGDARTSELRASVHAGTNEITLRPAVGGRGWNLPPLAARARSEPKPAVADTRTLTERERADATARARAERERDGAGRTAVNARRVGGYAINRSPPGERGEVP
ncbi:hypothetical protein J0H58_27245 [bacterium]|nr:hypothetical protein [bacterium]